MRRLTRPINGDVVFALALLAFALGYLALAYSYKPALGAVPAAIAWMLVVFLALALGSHTDTPLGRYLRRRVNPEAERPFFPAWRQIEAMLWVGGFAGALIVLGVLAAVPLFVVAFMHFRGRRPLWLSLIGSAAVTIFVWLLFAQLLRLELYPGLIFGGS